MSRSNERLSDDSVLFTMKEMIQETKKILKPWTEIKHRTGPTGLDIELPTPGRHIASVLLGGRSDRVSSIHIGHNLLCGPHPIYSYADVRGEGVSPLAGNCSALLISESIARAQDGTWMFGEETQSQVSSLVNYVGLKNTFRTSGTENGFFTELTYDRLEQLPEVHMSRILRVIESGSPAYQS